MAENFRALPGSARAQGGRARGGMTAGRQDRRGGQGMEASVLKKLLHLSGPSCRHMTRQSPPGCLWRTIRTQGTRLAMFAWSSPDSKKQAFTRADKSQPFPLPSLSASQPSKKGAHVPTTGKGEEGSCAREPGQGGRQPPPLSSRGPSCLFPVCSWYPVIFISTHDREESWLPSAVVLGSPAPPHIHTAPASLRRQAGTQGLAARLSFGAAFINQEANVP